MSESRSWLEGPLVPGENEDLAELSPYPGARLGLPKDGPGSLSPLFPRIGALAIDWLACYALAWFVVSMTSALGDSATARIIFFIAVSYTHL